MTDRKQNLTALRDAMVDGDLTRVSLSQVKSATGGHYFSYLYSAIKEADMNAALAFVAAVLPGWKWSAAVDVCNESCWASVESPCGDYKIDEVYASIPSLALTIAALNALIEIEDKG